MRSFIILAAAVSSAVAVVTRTGGTLTLANTNGARGNECITFRNNGEIVEAACVNTAVDRQITPGTLPSGQAVLFVERSFGAAQAARLVGKEPCVGFNGTHFRAEDCNALAGNQIVSLSANGQLVAGAACSTGVDRLSQMTVSANGGNCANYRSNTVQRTLDNAGTPAPGNAPVAAPPVAAPPAATTTRAAPPASTTRAANGNGAVTRNGGTRVLFDTRGQRGNECITFRNNGEIVEAACVNSAVDRQITPGTTASGQSVLFVERSFGAAQAARLVGVQPCIGFNGTHFRAEDCNSFGGNSGIQAVTLSNNGQLVVAGIPVCSNGVSRIAELTVSRNGRGCTTFTSTTVRRTVDNAGTPARTRRAQAFARRVVEKIAGRKAAPYVPLRMRRARS